MEWAVIREATSLDAWEIVSLGEEFFAESPKWGRLTFSAEKAEAAVRRLIDHEDALVLVSERGEEIVGVLIAVCEEHWTSMDKIASELVVFTAPDARGAASASQMVERMKEWAKEKGAKLLFAGTSTGVQPERTVTFYERHGFVRSSVGLEFAYV